MPQYTVTDPRSGKRVVLTGDSPPTEQELEEIFAKVNGPANESALAKLTGLAKGDAKITGPMSAIDSLLSYLPMIGGATGGIIGGAGGTAFGAGFGGVPGAVGGAAFGGATGEAMRQNGRRILGGTRTVPDTAGGAAKDIGTEAAMQAIYELGGEGISRGLSSGANAVYRGYLKPSLAKQSVGKADQIVKTALDEALPITKAGQGQAARVMSDLRQQVDQILASTPGTVDLHQVAEKVRAFAKAKYFKPGTPSADYEAALAVADSLDKHPALGLPPGAQPSRVSVDLQTANQTKRGLDTSIGESNFGMERGATKTTQKYARREMRQGIEAQAPAVGPLNAREGRLIDAAKTIARAVGRESNKSPLIGVNTLASAAFGAEEYKRTGNPYMSAVWALGARGALTPAVMSRAAIVAARMGRLPGAVPANIARVAVQAVLETQDEP